MRASFAIVVLWLLSTAARASANPPDRIDMGKWDCSGSKVRVVVVAPGAHDYVWHGHCSGAEGYDVVVTPRKHLRIKMSDDGTTHELVLHVTNPGTTPRRVKMHVFVGFA